MLDIWLLTPFIFALRASVAAKSVILGISPLASFILALREALVAKLIISGILYSIFFTLAFLHLFLTSFFTA